MALSFTTRDSHSCSSVARGAVRDQTKPRGDTNKDDTAFLPDWLIFTSEISYKMKNIYVA